MKLKKPSSVVEWDIPPHEGYRLSIWQLVLSASNKSGSRKNIEKR